MTRTFIKWSKFYADGYDLTGYSRTFGPLGIDYPTSPLACVPDSIKSSLPGIPVWSIGTLNAVMDNTAAIGLHVVASAAGADNINRNVMIPVGMATDPITGDPVFMGKFLQKGYTAIADDSGQATVTVPFADGAIDTTGMNYGNAWGRLVLPKGAQTGANSSNTPNINNGGATTAGGWLIYQIFAYSGTGSATISIDDSANGTSWAALSGATSGAIAHTAMPTAGIVQLATNATVRQYIRWQLSLATLTSVTIALAFVRG